MSDPYLGEIRMFAGSYAPNGWAYCDGGLLPISENDALFALIGTTYGGDGQTTFALPNLSSRIPFGSSSSQPIGTTGGVESVTLTGPQLPSHNHRARASSAAATSTSPAGKVWAASGNTPYTSNSPDVAMSAGALTPSGQSQPHENRPPYLAVGFIIALQGIFPSQS